LRLLGMGDTSAVRLLAPPVLNLSSCPIFRVHFNGSAGGYVGTGERAMNIHRHANATTTPKIRRYIQVSTHPVA